MLTLTKPLRTKEAAVAVAIDHTMRAKLPGLPNPIVASWHDRARLVLDRGEPWIIGPLETDPYRTKTGGYPFPRSVSDQLQRVSAGGARFHRIAIAHELDRGAPVQALLPKVPATGLVLQAEEAASLLGALPPAQKPKDLAARMDRAVKKVIRTARGAAGAAAGLLAAPLDPIVFGVVGLDGQPAAGASVIYYPLAAWKW